MNYIATYTVDGVQYSVTFDTAEKLKTWVAAKPSRAHDGYFYKAERLELTATTTVEIA